MAFRKYSKFVDNLIFGFFLSFGVLLGIVVILIANYVFQDNEIVKNVLNTIGSTVVVGAAFSLVFARISRNVHYEELKYLIEREDTGFKKIYSSTKDEEFRSDLIEKIPKAKEIKNVWSWFEYALGT